MEGVRAVTENFRSRLDDWKETMRHARQMVASALSVKANGFASGSKP